VSNFSFWNNTIAIASAGKIIILNGTTGGQEAVFSGHTGSVLSVAYSSDGVYLVSGSYDGTVKLWDVQTGGVVKVFYGHTGFAVSVSISADCTRIASGSSDKTACLWDTQTGKCHCIINQESVKHVSFSPTDPKHLLSIHYDKIWQWDINGYQVGHAYYGSHVAFSSDGTQFAICSSGAVVIRNSSSGLIVTKINWMDASSPSYPCFSPDGRLIAVATDDIAYVWDITSSDPYLIETLIGHTEDITSLTFSSPSSLISASRDCSIKFWQISSSSEHPPVADPEPAFQSRIKSITLQAKDGIIITSESSGIVRTWDILTGYCKASFQTPAKNFHDADAQLINGKLIFGWCANLKIYIWDVAKGELLSVIERPDFSHKLKISEDGSRVFCMTTTLIQAYSIQTGVCVGTVMLESIGPAESFSIDGSRVWAYRPNFEDKGWDFGTPGSLPILLPNIPAYRLHPNGIMLWDTGLHRIKDIRTGKVVFQLPKRYGRPHDVQWGGQYLVARFSVTKVLVLDFSHVF